MDTIFLDLECVACHGLTEKEQIVDQKFEVAVEVDVPVTVTENAAETDDIAATVDYRKLRAIVKAVFAESPHNLLETLANRIANSILGSNAGICAVRVSIRKPDIWEKGCPGVLVRRERKGEILS